MPIFARSNLQFMFVYRHKVHYYETDRMGVTHHSNYIRIMEEARVAYLDAIGASFARIEADGIVSPVMSVEGRFLHPTTFDDLIEVEVSIREMSALKLKIGYRMRCNGKEVFEGCSLHCFLDKDRRAIRFAERYPQFRTPIAEEEE